MIPIELPRLVVDAPAIGNGVQYTARLGDKWLKNFANGTRKVAVVFKDGRAAGVADIVGIAYAPYSMQDTTPFIDNFEPDNHEDCVTVIAFAMENELRNG